MRKIIALAMAAVLCISLCACTETETANEPTSKAPEQSQQATVSTEAGNSAHPLQLGEKADAGFVSLEFSSAALTYSVGGHGLSTTAGDGKRCFSLVGIAENTGNAPLPIETMCAEMVFNDQYTYTAYGKMIDSDRIPASLAPLEQNGFWVYAEIPENLVDQLESCETLPVNCLHMPRYDATTEIVSGATNEPVRTRFCTERLGTLPPEVMSIPPANAVRT